MADRPARNLKARDRRGTMPANFTMRQLGLYFSAPYRSTLAAGATIGCSLLLAASACDKKSELAPAVDALQPSKTDSAKAQIWAIDGNGRTTLRLDGTVETVLGETSKTRGTLQIQLDDLRRTRGSIGIDLASLSMQSFEDPAKNRKQASDARTWLEVPDSSAGPGAKDKYKWATFAIRDIAAAEPNDLAAQSGDKRVSRITVSGDFQLHGRVSPVTLQLDSTFTFSGGQPTGLEIQSREPFRVNLEAHDVRPRDSVGRLIAKVSEALQMKVGEDAEISVQLEAKPTGKRVELAPAPPPPRPPPVIRPAATTPEQVPTGAPGQASTAERKPAEP